MPGDLLRAATNGDAATCLKLLALPEGQIPDDDLNAPDVIEKRRDPDGLKGALDGGKAYTTSVLLEACHHSMTEVVAALLARKDFTAEAANLRREIGETTRGEGWGRGGFGNPGGGCARFLAVGGTALHVAASAGSVGCCKALLDSEKFSDDSVGDEWSLSGNSWPGHTALHCAAENGRADVVKFLLDCERFSSAEEGSLIGAAGRAQDTALHRAVDPEDFDGISRVSEEHAETVRVLLTHPKFHPHLTATDWSGKTARDLAKDGTAAAARENDDCERAQARPSSASSSSSVSSSSGIDPETCARTLRNHVTVLDAFNDCVGEEVVNILMRLANEGLEDEALKQLAAHPAGAADQHTANNSKYSVNSSPETDGYGSTVLHCASARGLSRLVYALLERPDLDPQVANLNLGYSDEAVDTDPKTRDGPRSGTPLYQAAKNGHAECIRVLLRNRDKYTAVEDAFVRTSNHGQGQSFPRYTPLHVAAGMGNIEAVRVLLNHERFSADAVTAEAKGGDTCLHLAAASSENAKDLCSLILGHQKFAQSKGGRMVNHCNRDGETAETIAKVYGGEKTLEAFTAWKEQDAKKRAAAASGADAAGSGGAGDGRLRSAGRRRAGPR